jgi:hypothetical protein
MLTATSATVAANVTACLTVNGVTCATPVQSQALTTSGETYTFGTGNLMDLWQGTGVWKPGITVVDVTESEGNVTVAGSTVTWVNGDPFNIKWVSGSKINIGGSPYTITAVGNDASLTISSPPSAGSYAYTADNFGVLIGCSAASGTCSIGPTTYAISTAPNAQWPSASTSPTSPALTINGKQSYLYFSQTELFAIAADGSTSNDLGSAVTTYNNITELWSSGQGCGSNCQYQFDPQIPNCWYANIIYFGGTNHIVQVCYEGNYAATTTPGATIADCAQTTPINTHPCLQFTPMTGDIIAESTSFNPKCASLSSATAWTLDGISPDGYLGVVGDTQQNSFGCLAMWTAGTAIPRQPEGTPGGFQLIGATSTFSTPPFSWCNNHDTIAPVTGGWIGLTSNESLPAAQVYSMTLTSAAFNTGSGAGGLQACPVPNPFGVTGNDCTTITVNGKPVNNSAQSIQSVQVGDVLQADATEQMRVLAWTSDTSMIVQRGYLSTAASHASTTLTMLCGTFNQYTANSSAYTGYWHASADPLGANPGFSTIITDAQNAGGHGYANGSNPGQPVTVNAAGTGVLSTALCPNPFYCAQTRTGNYIQAQTAIVGAYAINPMFAGVQGLSTPGAATAVVDMHPGPCSGATCMDVRPFVGGQPTLGTSGSPFTSTTGQCYVLTSAMPLLKNRILSTIAYVGRSSLTDVSGPNSVSNFGCTNSNSYEFCNVLIAGECVAGSAANSVYVNAPYVRYGYCWPWPVANQEDDVNAICIGDAGAYVNQVVQEGWTTNDMTGSTFRPLGPAYQRPNDMYVFASANTITSGILAGEYGRWLDGVRGEVITTMLPPMHGQDGVNRGSFVPIEVDIPGGQNVSTAAVQFWYGEYGNGCTPRQENCIAVGSTVNLTTPFYWNSESWTGQSCASGCPITIPALSGKTLYYTYSYNGGMIYSSPVSVVMVP